MATATFNPTAEQSAVISHRRSHLQVIACAGAGKTEAISRRVCSFIEESVELIAIMAFTFTEREAASLNRVAKTVNDDLHQRVRSRPAIARRG